MKKRAILPAFLTCLALVLVLSAAVSPSLSYFTTYVTAQGGYTVRLQRVETDVEETFDGGAKHVTIVNTGEADCYVRVKVLAGSLVELSISGAGWSEGADGYWYYSAILKPGERSAELRVDITPQKGLAQDYNVVVVEECTPVLYTADGQPYADWTMKAEVS